MPTTTQVSDAHMARALAVLSQKPDMLIDEALERSANVSIDPALLAGDPEPTLEELWQAAFEAAVAEGKTPEEAEEIADDLHPLGSIDEGTEEQPVNSLVANRAKSEVQKPVAVVHGIVAANPTMRRKELQALCEAAGVNKWTARTQIQVALANAKQNNVAAASSTAHIIEDVDYSQGPCAD
jgi:hypothetical protein